MRRMSFALTTEQVRNRTKTVTRRMGWEFLKPGDLIQPVVKGMGLKKGQRQELIGGPIRVTHVGHVTVDDIVWMDGDLAREGFPDMTPWEFIEMFCRTHRCEPADHCTRIEFEYVDGEGTTGAHGMHGNARKGTDGQ